MQFGDRQAINDVTMLARITKYTLGELATAIEESLKSGYSYDVLVLSVSNCCGCIDHGKEFTVLDAVPNEAPLQELHQTLF